MLNHSSPETKGAGIIPGTEHNQTKVQTGSYWELEEIGENRMQGMDGHFRAKG